jgi:hypothetical protein
MMRRGTTWPLLAVALMVAGAPAAAQGGFSVPEAENTVRRLFTDLDSMRWSDAAARFHPLAVERFRTAQLDQVHAMRRMSTAAMYRGYDGEAPPPAVAAWLARRDSVARALFQPILVRGFARVTYPAQLDSLTAPEMLARWLEAHDQRLQMQSLRARMAPAAAARISDDSLPQLVRTVLGSVQEDDTTAHVLVRSRQTGFGGGMAGFGDVSVVTMRRATAGWRLWTADGYSSWLGGAFGYGVENGNSAAERAAHLDAVRDSTLDWRDPASQTRVRAAIVGYPGGGRAPRGLLVEVRAPDGSLSSAEIPAGSFEAVMRYIGPWMAAVRESAYRQ